MTIAQLPNLHRQIVAYLGELSTHDVALYTSMNAPRRALEHSNTQTESCPLFHVCSITSGTEGCQSSRGHGKQPNVRRAMIDGVLAERIA